MNRRTLLLLPTLIAGAGLWWAAAHARTGRASPAPPATTRQSVELTVYAQDFGMVREVRPMALTRGPNQLLLRDVSKTLDPQSVLLRWQGAGPTPRNSSPTPMTSARAAATSF